MALAADTRDKNGVGIVAFVPDTWGGVWQLRQQVLTRLARRFHVIWVDPAPGWRQFFSGGRGGKTLLRPGVTGVPGFAVLRANRWQPTVYRPEAIGRALLGSRVRGACRYLRKQGANRLVGYLWRPEFSASLDACDFDLTCYHIDDEYSFSDTEVPVNDGERRIIESVDQVFIHSPAMMEKKGDLNPHTMYAPNGVDFAAFTSSRPVPEDLARIDGPTVGYIGLLQSTIDWRLVRAVAEANNEIAFVFVGPEGHLESDDKLQLDALRSFSNTYFLGGKDVDVLPDYAQHLDVCTMPYKQNDYTKYIFPLKVNEYLAAGKPTVGTPIRSLKEYADVVELAEDADAWNAALARCLDPASRSGDAIDRRRSTARAYDWGILVERIALAIEEGLAAIGPGKLRS